MHLQDRGTRQLGSSTRFAGRRRVQPVVSARNDSQIDDAIAAPASSSRNDRTQSSAPPRKSGRARSPPARGPRASPGSGPVSTPRPGADPFVSSWWAMTRQASARLLGRPWENAGGRGTFPRGEGMEFLILGPLEVRDAGRSLAIGGARQRALLAILLTRANQVIGRDALIDELWGESPPETATNVLQGYISHLRKAIGTTFCRRGLRVMSRSSIPGRSTSTGSRSFWPRGARRWDMVTRQWQPHRSGPPSSCGAARRSPTSPTSRSRRPRSRGSRSYA